MNDDDLFDDDDETDGPETGFQGVALSRDGDDDAVAIGDMSPRDFARLGLNHIAYVRAVREPIAAADDGEPGSDADADADADAGDDTGPPPLRWAIHAANGKRIGMAPSPELAFAATRQHDMEPLSVH